MADDPLATLQSFISDMNQTASSVLQAAENAEKKAKELEDLGRDIADKGEALFKDVETFHETLGQSIEENIGEIGELREALTQMAEQRLQAAAQEVERLGEASQEILIGMRDELQSEWNDMLSKGWEVVATGHQHLVDSVTTLDDMADDAFETLGSGLGDMESLLESSVLTATLGKFEAMSSEVTGAITSTMESAFGDISEAVKGQFTGDLDEAFTQLTSMFTETFTQFGDNVTEVASTLVEKGTEVFTDMAGHAQEHVIETITDGVTEMVEDVLEALASEFVEAIAMMGVGASTTAALGPYVPLLVAAKAVAGTINDLLEAMSFGLA
jgi:hypothetical protein